MAVAEATRPCARGVTDRAVVLAAGRGTRMQRPPDGIELDADQRRMAERGLKGLIPFHGQPFLAYVASALADAGIREICLVVRPGDDPVRSTFERIPTTRLQLSFAVQHEPRGAAHALLAAERFAGDAPFIVVNADNLYPPGVVAPLLDLDGPALAGFHPETLAAGGIPRDRLRGYAIVTANDDGFLTDIIEKPDPAVLRRNARSGWISMTCWRFDPDIFDACRRIRPSPRGELELPDAVLAAVRDFGRRFRVVPADEPVLDLSLPEDIPEVARRLRGARARL